MFPCDNPHSSLPILIISSDEDEDDKEPPVKKLRNGNQENILSPSIPAFNSLEHKKLRKNNDTIEYINGNRLRTINLSSDEETDENKAHNVSEEIYRKNKMHSKKLHGVGKKTLLPRAWCSKSNPQQKTSIMQKSLPEKEESTPFLPLGTDHNLTKKKDSPISLTTPCSVNEVDLPKESTDVPYDIVIKGCYTLNTDTLDTEKEETISKYLPHENDCSEKLIGNHLLENSTTSDKGSTSVLENKCSETKIKSSENNVLAVIDLDEDDCEISNEVENNLDLIQSRPVNETLQELNSTSSPSTSKGNSSEDIEVTKQGNKSKTVTKETPEVEVPKELLTFLDKVVETSKNATFKNIVMRKKQKLLKLYQSADTNFLQSKEFLESIREANLQVQQSSIIKNFADIFINIKHAVTKPPVRRQVRQHLKKLKTRYKHLHLKIKQLETTEVNFDNENDSTYEQLHRYQQKIVDIHKKICELEKKNPHEGRVIYSRIDFHQSKYVEMNKAINHSVKNNGQFVNFESFQKSIKKYFRENNITVLSNSDLFNAEVKRCFEIVGEKQQRLRKTDLYYIQQSYLPPDAEDPYEKDETLRNVLDASKQRHDNQIAEVIFRYAQKEEELRKGSREQPTPESVTEAESL